MINNKNDLSVILHRTCMIHTHKHKKLLYTRIKETISLWYLVQ